MGAVAILRRHPYHPDVGDIDPIWGEAPAKGVEGYGLARIVAKHPDVAEKLQEILDNSQVVGKSPNRVVLADPAHKAVVSLEFKDAEKKWLLTAYEKTAPISLSRRRLPEVRLRPPVLPRGRKEVREPHSSSLRRAANLNHPPGRRLTFPALARRNGTAPPPGGSESSMGATGAEDNMSANEVRIVLLR